MASKDGYQKLGKLIEAGVTVAKIAQSKAEESVRDLMHLSEVQRNQMRELFEEAAARSKESSESLLKSLRKELEKQLKATNLVSREELIKLSERLNSVTQELSKLSALQAEIHRLTEMVNTLLRHLSRLGSSETRPVPDTSSSPVSDASSGKGDQPAGQRKSTVSPAKPARSRPSTKRPGSSTKDVSSLSQRSGTEPASPAKGDSRGDPN